MTDLSTRVIVKIIESVRQAPPSDALVDLVRVSFGGFKLGLDQIHPVAEALARILGVDVDTVREEAG